MFLRGRGRTKVGNKWLFKELNSPNKFGSDVHSSFQLATVVEVLISNKICRTIKVYVAIFLGIFVNTSKKDMCIYIKLIKWFL